MKRKLALALIIASLLFPTSTSAHGGPPFILVNGKANLTNPAASGSVFFKVPNEIGAESFVINQTLNFKIDTNLLPVSPDTVEPSDFVWEFGNGKTGSSLSTTTSYSKAGSYLVILKVKDPNYQDPIELETMQVNILPNKNAQVPKAVIKINGKTITDPFIEPVFIGKDSNVEFDARGSQGKIKTYKWDFGDGSKLATGEKVEHKFDFSQPYAYSFFSVLRVEDENGLYSDTVVQVSKEEDSTKATASDSAGSNAGKLNFTPFAVASAILVLVGIGAFVILNKKSSKKK